jgi:transposase
MSLQKDARQHECQGCEALKQTVAELAAKVHWFEEQLRLAQRRRFGSSSEGSSEGQQQLIFNEAEVEADSEAPEPGIPESGAPENDRPRRKKKKRRRKPASLDELPVTTVHYHLSEGEQVCPECQGPLHEMSTETRRTVKIVPAQAIVIEEVAHVYSCRQCEQEATSTPVIAAQMPPTVIPGSPASASLLAFIMDQKYVTGLPLYRQEQQFARLGILFPRQNLANWMLKGADLLTPLYHLMHDRLLLRDILHADETTLQVLREPGRSAQAKSYLWLYRTGSDGPPIVLFNYQQTRAAIHPIEFLKDFTGFLHVDGYAAYEKLPDVTLCGCWAHARRKFHEALNVLPPSTRVNAGTAAKQGLAFCNKLFAIERELRDATPEERRAGRLERSEPVLKAFKKWLDTHAAMALPKTMFGRAVNYCLNQWDKLVTFLQDGRLELDNNRSERSIKPFVIGRKNWLFANTPSGAHASATIYSIVETAKENGLIPFAYLTHLFEELPKLRNTTDPDLDALLPWSPTLPDSCRAKSESTEKA